MNVDSDPRAVKVDSTRPIVAIRSADGTFFDCLVQPSIDDAVNLFVSMVVNNPQMPRDFQLYHIANLDVRTANVIPCEKTCIFIPPMKVSDSNEI